MSGWDDLVVSGEAHRDVALAAYTTYKLGGPADLMVEADSPAVLVKVAQAMGADPRPVLVIGRGSNLLVADAGFRGVVLRLGRGFSQVIVDEVGIVEAGGSLSLPRMARAASEAGRGGLEWCVGVPGSVGGAVRQNAGCFDRETVDVLVDVEMVDLADGSVSRFPATSLDLGYRSSNLVSTQVVTRARFATTVSDPGRSAEEMRVVTRWRRDHQPGGTLNAGSVFKNPLDVAAAVVIDGLGLKGFTIGEVRVSARHANFIEAGPGATADDVHRLIETVRSRVDQETGRLLEPEVQYVGFGEGE